MSTCRIFVTLAVLSGVQAVDVTPIEKVITLLKDLKSNTEANGKTEATTYGKFSCFCKDKTKAKSDSIKKEQDNIDTAVANINSKTATKATKISKKQEQQQVIEDKNVELQKATEQHTADSHAWTTLEANLNQAITSAKKAHKALSDSKPKAALLQESVKSDVRNCLDLAEALNMIPSSQEAVTSFLAVDPSDPAFKFHSQKILDIIKKLQDDFTDEKTDKAAEWKKTDDTFIAEEKGLKASIKSATKQVADLTGAIDKLKSEIADENIDLSNANDSLKDDSAYLSDLTARCQEKGEAWDQRTKARSGEVEALDKALKILEGDKVKGNAQAAAAKRAMLVHVKPPAPAVAKVAPKAPVVAAPVAAVVVAAKKPEAAKVVVAAKKPESAKVAVAVKKAVSFLQMTRAQKAQDQAIASLRQEGARLHSDMLSSVADQIMADPFVKIKKLIQGLIERLLEESKNEATKKGMCDTELGKSRTTRDNRFADVGQLDADLAELHAQKTTLTAEIATLTLELDGDKDGSSDAEKEGLEKNLVSVGDLRKTEKTENEKSIKEAGEGAVAVADALKTLQDYYKTAAKASFVQVSASPIDEAANSKAGFDSAYKGDQDSSKAILGLLKVIQTDFERSVRQTTAAEEEAHAEWIQFQRASKSDISAKTTKKKLDEQDLATTKSAIAKGMEDLKTASKLLDGALKTIEDLQPTCIDTGMSYKDRVQKREDEIKALTTALCQLDPEKVESECKP